jgi:hypothetical protein
MMMMIIIILTISTSIFIIEMKTMSIILVAQRF